MYNLTYSTLWVKILKKRVYKLSEELLIYKIRIKINITQEPDGRIRVKVIIDVGNIDKKL